MTHSTSGSYNERTLCPWTTTFSPAFGMKVSNVISIEQGQGYPEVPPLPFGVDPAHDLNVFLRHRLLPQPAGIRRNFTRQDLAELIGRLADHHHHPSLTLAA
jgi:hypothetical protein